MLRAVILDTNAVARNLLTSVLTNGGHEVIADSNLAPASLAKACCTSGLKIDRPG